MKSYGYYNPSGKLLTFLIVAIAPLLVPSLLGIVGEALILLALMPIVYMETYEKKRLRKHYNRIVLIVGVVIIVVAYLMKVEPYMYYGYDIAPIYIGLFSSLYFGNMYLYGRIVTTTTTLFELCMSLHETCYFPLKHAYRLYRSLLFAIHMPEEYALVKHIYASRNVVVGAWSLKVMRLVIRNLKRKFASNDLMMEAKGFDALAKNTHHVAIPLKEWMIPLGIVAVLVVTYVVRLKGWTI